MKRVLIFSLTYHPFIGGAEVAIKEITDRLDPLKYQFDMITLRFNSNLPRVEKIGNITVYRIGFSLPGARVSDRAMPLACKIAKALFPLTAFWKALFLHRSHRYAIVWAMMANQAGFAALFFKWMYPHVRYFLELQDGRPLKDMTSRRPILGVLWPLYLRVYRAADLIKCISYFLAAEVRSLNYAGPLEVIPNGVDVRKFSATIAPEKKESLKLRFNKRPGDIFLFTASRLVLSRGVEDAIEALAHLPATVKFLIAGEGQDREKLEHIASGLGVRERVMFAGHVSHDELPAYLGISNIFVRPSIIEGFGNSFVEAFAAGLPVIGTPVGGIPDFLFDPESDPEKQPTGIFCKVRDPRSIAQAVEKYIQDPPPTARIIENAKKLAKDTYDWDIIALNMHKKIFNVL